MERTKTGTTNTITTYEQKLLSLAGALVSRANFANSLGMTYNGDRDIYKALGYPININYKDYASRYIRQDMAKAIIEKVDKVNDGNILFIEAKGMTIMLDIIKEGTNQRKDYDIILCRCGAIAHLGDMTVRGGLGYYG